MHLSSLWMPVLVWLLPFEIMSIVLSVLLGIMLWWERVRIYGMKKANSILKGPHNLILKFVTPLLRKHESSGRLTGATMVIIAAWVAVLIFPMHIAVGSLLIMLVGDAFAAIVGRAVGRHNEMGKSWAGSIAFILSSYGVLSAFAIFTHQHHMFFGISAAGVIAGMLAERYLPFDDNLSIVLSSGVVLWIGEIICFG